MILAITVFLCMAVRLMFADAVLMLRVVYWNQRLRRRKSVVAVWPQYCNYTELYTCEQGQSHTSAMFT